MQPSRASITEPVARKWRSLLFVPANNPGLLSKAHSYGADAVIIDLEDAVADTDKPLARSVLPGAIEQLYERGIDVVVRINPSWRDSIRDLEAAVMPGLAAIMVPKVETPERITIIAEIIDELANERQLAGNKFGLIALLESPAALSVLSSIAAQERLVGLALGTEDFALALGVLPTEACLDLPVRLMALAAATYKLMCFAAPISIAAYNNISEYRAALSAARAVGASGAICIHPNQVRIANECFSVDEKEFNEAEAILAAWATAQREGRSVTSVGGRMIDRPVAQRAMQIVAQRSATPPKS